MFNKATDSHQNSQLLNPFVTERTSTRPKFSKEEYGKWVSLKCFDCNRWVMCLMYFVCFFLSNEFQTDCGELDRSTRTKSEYARFQRNVRIMWSHLANGLFTWSRDTAIKSDLIWRIVQCELDFPSTWHIFLEHLTNDDFFFVFFRCTSR